MSLTTRAILGASLAIFALGGLAVLLQVAGIDRHISALRGELLPRTVHLEPVAPMEVQMEECPKITKKLPDGTVVEIPLGKEACRQPDETAAEWAARLRALIEEFCKGWGD